MLKRNDIILLFSVIIIALGSFLLLNLLFSEPAVSVKIYVNNKIVYTGSIYEDKQVALDGNSVVIEDGIVFMKDATCKNQICVNHKSIQYSGESIICLPNKVIVEVTGE